MKKSRFSEERIIGILKAQGAGVLVAEVCRKHGMSDASFYMWKAKYGGLNVSEAKRLRGLEAENAKLKRLLAEAMLDTAARKDLVGKKWCHLRWLLQQASPAGSSSQLRLQHGERP